MIICLCEGVSDRVIRSEIRRGCTSMRALRAATGAASCCGQCACDLKRMLREAAPLHPVNAAPLPAARTA